MHLNHITLVRYFFYWNSYFLFIQSFDFKFKLMRVANFMIAVKLFQIVGVEYCEFFIAFGQNQYSFWDSSV